ncbi:64 kda mitochondrial nadh dehydrogenase [Phaffia rhodozyma]|uniref:64 kDa mitochondrial nadh dehydrogenase n=1 Tax=Phaffia rhodozyma TaxID=264483 RepID=A0A0F7SHM6_PHARH|nr:64 kda mitochondrial nadh dehydrogenase [Phaffia rhodozyma]
MLASRLPSRLGAAQLRAIHAHSSRMTTHSFGAAFRTVHSSPPSIEPASNKNNAFTRSIIVRILARLVFSSVLGICVVTGVILGHDALTYGTTHVEKVPVHPLALKPETGGPRNLPILARDISDMEKDRSRHNVDSMGVETEKPRLVIVGGGWGSVGLLKTIRPGDYNVTVIAPDNYSLFTPLLPSATVGTVETRSLVEPLRRTLARVRGHFIQAKAVDLEMAEQLIEIETSAGQRVYVPYDKLVIACGSSSNTHGVNGLEHCFQLKTIPDAQSIRRRILDNLEKASLPTTSEKERKKLLSFVICGGGPTGVEFASELIDMMNEDALTYFPKLLRNELSVSIVQSRDHILNTYSEKISQYAEARFARNEIDVITNARVQRVFDDSVVISVKDPKNPDSKPVEKTLPSGFTLWSTGIAMNPFTKTLVQKLPNQFHSKAVEVDNHLRVTGAPKGTVYAIGDAATIETKLVNHLLELFDECDVNKDGKINYQEWEKMADIIRKKHPLAEKQFIKIKEIFDQYDTDKDGNLGLNEVAEMFIRISNKITTLPPTAQVANQQGVYLGQKFLKLAKEVKKDPGSSILANDDLYHPHFQYKHLGSLASLGSAGAAFDLDGVGSFAGGLVAMYAWRSIYWSEQTSMRTRAMLMIDWCKRGLFGRDISRF